MYRSIQCAFLVILLFLAASPLEAQNLQNETRVPRSGALPGPDNTAFAYAEPEELGLDSGALKALADSVEKRVSRGELVGAEIMVIKDDRIVLHEAIGWSDREKDIPLQRNSIYRIRSMTKPLVATAVLMLVEEGKLSLNDKAAEFLASFANERSGSITIRELLTYTSGLRDYGFFDMGLPKDPDEYETLRDLVDDVGEIGPLEPVGEFHYSGGSGVLPAIVSEITGMPYERFIETRILDPLQMNDTHTAFRPDADWADRMNSTYRWNGKGTGFERYWDSSMEQRYQYFRGAGGLYSTTSDYARFISIWMNEGSYDGVTLLSAESVHEAVRPLAGGQYGMHWRVPRTPIVSDMPMMFGHAGSDGTLALALPALDTIVLYFTQSRGPVVVEPFWYQLSQMPPFNRHVASRWHAKLVDAHETVPLPVRVEDGSRYIGTYVGGIILQGEERMPGQWTYTVGREGDLLVGNLSRTGFEMNHTIPPSHHLLYQNDERVIPGRVLDGRVVEVLPDVRIEFDGMQAGAATHVEIETMGDQGMMVWRLERQE